MTCEIFAENAVQINNDITPEDYCNGFARCGRGGLDVNSANLNFVFRDAFTRILALEGGTTVVNNDTTGSDIPATPPITPPNAPSNPKDGDIVITHYDNGMCVAEYNFTTGIWETNCHLSDDDNVGEASTAGTDIYGNTYGSGDPIVTLDNGDIISLTPIDQVGPEIPVLNLDDTTWPTGMSNGIQVYTINGVAVGISRDGVKTPIILSTTRNIGPVISPVTNLNALDPDEVTPNTFVYGSPASINLPSDPIRDLLWTVFIRGEWFTGARNLPAEGSKVVYRLEFDNGSGTFIPVLPQHGDSVQADPQLPFSAHQWVERPMEIAFVKVTAGSTPTLIQARSGVGVAPNTISRILAMPQTPSASVLTVSPRSIMWAIGTPQ